MSLRSLLVALLALALGATLIVAVARRPGSADRAGAEREARPEGASTAPSTGAAESGDAPGERSGRDRDRDRALDEILGLLEKSDGRDARRMREDLERLREVLAGLEKDVDPLQRERLVRLLSAIDARWRPSAGTIIGELPPNPATVALLLDLLRSDESDVTTRRGVLNALAGMRAEDAVADLLALVGKGRPEEAHIVEALGRIGSPSAVRELVGWLDRDIPEQTRVQIEAALATENGAQALDAAVLALGSAPPARQLSLLRVLARIGGPAHGAPVRALLAQELAREVRWTAIQALATIGDAESGAALWNLYRSGDKRDRSAALRALRQLRNPRTIEQLIVAPTQLDLAAKRAFLNAGAEVQRPGPKLVALAESQLGSADRDLKIPAIRVAGASGQTRLVAPLLKLFREQRDRTTRGAVLDALLAMDQAAATEAGVEALNEAEAELRRDYLPRFEMAQRNHGTSSSR